MRLILYDGDCGLCNRSVLHVVKSDTEGQFHFASIQSAPGRKYLSQHGIPNPQLDTFYLIDDDQLYERSEAAVRVGKRLRGWAWLATFIGWWPRKLRDWCYDRVAANRHRFGKKDACQLVDSELRKRFLDQNL
ncbi:MAG: DUF393 domain-containing protein [Verrucomicrobiota bacterium]